MAVKKPTIYVVSGICGALLVIAAFSKEINKTYKDTCIRPLVANMIDDRLGNIEKNVLILLENSERTAKRDSVAAEDWDAAVRSVERLLETKKK